MPWIQKNLALVLGGLVGLLLLGAGGWFWFTQSQRDQEIGAQLEAKTAEWNLLVARKPYPSDANIEAVRAEEKRLEQLREVLRAGFEPVAAATVTDPLELKVLIETAIASMQDEAEAAGVMLPSRQYAFTFQSLRPMAPSQFTSNAIPTLAEQVAQVGSVARVLFASRIHSLEAIRRPPVLKEEGGSGDYLALKPVAGDLVTRMPMEVTFRSFAGELAGVITGLAGLSNTVVIKRINVEPTTISAAAPDQPLMRMAPLAPPTAEGPGPESRGDPYARLRGGGRDGGLASRYGVGPGGRPPGGGMSPELASRYGLGPAAGVPPAGAGPVAASPAPGAPAVVVDEKPLRATLQFDFIKRKPAPPAPARRAN
ncbi:MAG: hypothetical protein ACKVYV_18525 [Limisphaerales bacterium]